jgi:hypothetical protein
MNLTCMGSTHVHKHVVYIHIKEHIMYEPHLYG